MLKIWGRTNSVNVKKALWAAAELGLEYERVDAGMQFGVTRTPEYISMNPNSLVPTIEDDGFVLWESHSIVRYLAAKHGAGTLWPTDLRQRADAERWMDWAFTLQGAMRDVFWGLIRTPPEKRDGKAIEAGARRSRELLQAVLEKNLEKRPYVTGGSFTMGDIPVGCEVQRWMRVPIERPRLPAVEAWFERLRARPAFLELVDVPLT
ncbi:MAG TPA: glutathione S-transferase family protein [Burkholderiales bacterium]|nr:glutathione S-transferase family protein [Burkholderiales bacterium]